MAQSRRFDNGSGTKAVLFDLDDTLFDHRACLRRGLAAVREKFPSLQRWAPSDLEQTYLALIEDLHEKVLQGLVTINEARVERFRQFFQERGIAVTPAQVRAAADAHREAYQAERRPLPGALELLRELRSTVRIGVITNNVASEQRGKIRACGLTPWLDVVIISEEIGLAKPDPAMFRVALERIGCAAEEAVMVGDSWNIDVLGAVGAGIRPVWLNRFQMPCPDASVATVLAGLEPTEDVVRVLLLGDRDAAHHKR